MNTGSFFIDDEHDWQDVEPGIQRKIVAHTPDLMAVCVKFDLGAVGTPHQHEIHDQIGYVVQGAFEVELDGEKRRLGPAMPSSRRITPCMAPWHWSQRVW